MVAIKTADIDVSASVCRSCDYFDVCDVRVQAHGTVTECSVFKLSGRKDDTGKPRMGLLPFDALTEVAKVLTYGAIKYEPDNWKKVSEGTARYTDALLRHLAAWQGGETFDPEAADTRIRHIAQVACNALFLIWFELHEEEKQ